MKASVSLVVVMGITWVMGVLVFTSHLLPLAYIFTIFVAFQVSPPPLSLSLSHTMLLFSFDLPSFQGLIIFIVLVVFSKQVSLCEIFY